MRFSTVVAALVPAVAVSAQQTFTVIVGPNNTNTFSPTTVDALVGDTIAFQFQSRNHTVTQSTFATPCMEMTTPVMGIDSGFMPVAANATAFPQYSFTLTNTSAPLWFYCRQTGHCQQGMVFAVNPTAAESFATFQTAAMASNSNGSSGSTSSSASTTSSTATSARSSTTATSVRSSSTPSTSASARTGGAMKSSGNAAAALAVVGIAAGVLL